MRVLYGVTGEGLGHAMRAVVAVDHLSKRGHQVKLAASGRAREWLARRYADVVAIDGFALRYRAGRLSRAETARHLARSGPRALRNNVARYFDHIADFEPEVCFTDFDSFAHMIGLARRVPIISFDHQHVITRCDHGAAIRRSVGADLRIARAVVRAKMARCDHYVVTSFFQPRIRARCTADTTLVGPILRDEVLGRTPTDGGHVLVYQTSAGHDALLRALAAVEERKFVVYGAGEGGARNVVHKRFDPVGFLDDLASASAVITNGGHGVLSEALSLGKPVMSIPLRRQGEQQLNAAYLEHLGLGVRARRADARSVRSFVDWVRERDMRAPIVSPGNGAAVAAFDRLLEHI